MLSEISVKTLERLPIYLRFLEQKKKEGLVNISTPMIASSLGLSDILVKKDLMAVISTSGKPKIGHSVDSLINDLKDYLGYNNNNSAVLVGAGHLGKALLNYNGFKKMNMEIVVAFDNDIEVVDTEINGIKIMDISKMEDLCERMSIHIGIITTNDASAQEVCNKLVSAGVKAIWNFAPVTLKVPKGIIVQNENLASSLAVLSSKLKKVL